MTMGVVREKGSGDVTLDEPFLIIQLTYMGIVGLKIEHDNPKQRFLLPSHTSVTVGVIRESGSALFHQERPKMFLGFASSGPVSAVLNLRSQSQVMYGLLEGCGVQICGLHSRTGTQKTARTYSDPEQCLVRTE
jgi:hypothetical protein